MKINFLDFGFTMIDDNVKKKNTVQHHIKKTI